MRITAGSAPSPSPRSRKVSELHPQNFGTLGFPHHNEKAPQTLICGAFKYGGRGRNRTGVDGFAIRSITTLLLGLKCPKLLSLLQTRFNSLLSKEFLLTPCGVSGIMYSFFDLGNPLFTFFLLSALTGCLNTVAGIACRGF